MQTLWTKALQVKSSCRCPSCVTHPNKRATSARRVNNIAPNAAARRRQIKSPELLLSALFTTTVAAAAAADSRYKQGRREDLDGALIAAKEDLRAIDADQSRRLKALGLDIREVSSAPASPLSSEERALGVGRVPYDQTLFGNFDRLQAWRLPRSELLSQDKIDDNLNLFALQGSLPEVTEPELEDEPLSLDEAEDEPVQKQDTRRKRDRSRLKTKNLKIETRKNRWVEKSGSRFYAEVDTSIPSSASLSRLLLSAKSVDTSVGKSDEEAWARLGTPHVNERGVLQCQNAMAALIYRIILSRLHKTGSFSVNFQHEYKTFTKDDEEALQASLTVLNRTRRGLIQSARTSKDLVREIQPCSFPPYEWIHRDERRRYLQGVAHQERDLLELFARPMSQNELLSRLCSLLACQTHAPNVHTFNILIVRLSYLQLPHLVKHVIEAMKETFQVQNEITHTAALQCYADIDHAPKFHEHLNNMEGISGKGFFPAEGKENIKNQDSASRITAYPVAKHLSNGFKSSSVPSVKYLKVPRTLKMYEAIIGGLLKFKNIQRALAEYARMIRTGFRPTIGIYQSFLEYCVRLKAWKIGWIIWDDICSHVQTDDPVVYYWMLQLCASCGRQSEFKLVNGQAMRHKIIDCELDMDHFKWTQSEFDQTFAFAEAVQRLRRNPQIPGYPTEELHGPEFEAEWPANLYTMMKEQLAVLSSGKRDSVGFYVKPSFDDRVKHPSVWASRPGVQETKGKKAKKVKKTVITIRYS